MTTQPGRQYRVPDLPAGLGDFRFLYFSEVVRRPVCVGSIKNRLGRVTDLVFHLREPYPEAVGVYLEHGWGKPTQFIPWDCVVKIDEDAVFVKPPDEDRYPPFVDQPGWLLLDRHLMGRTVLDMDGRRIEVVNDVHLLESRRRLLVVHVDFSLNGFLRRWGLGRLRWIADQLISWKYVQPLSLEDAPTTDRVSLSITRRQILELPSEDLADALEELSGEEQQALFSALDSEKAAETLAEAEPRAQRQLIASLRKERARTILSEMTVPQLADLFSVLPHDDMIELIDLLPGEQGDRIRVILSEREVTANALQSSDYIARGKDETVGEALAALRRSGMDPAAISYVYVVTNANILLGVVDLRELVLAAENATLGSLMSAPVVAAEEDDSRDDVVDIFAKYHYRMIPVADAQDHLLGVIRYNDVMKGVVARLKA